MLELEPKRVVRLELPQDEELHHDKLNEYTNSNYGLLVRRLIETGYLVADKASRLAEPSNLRPSVA